MWWFKKRSPYKFKIGLALGGGGARGLAHVGVLKILEQAGIHPQIVVGTSMGSIIGALYCHLQTAPALEQKILECLHKPEIAKLGFKKFASQVSSQYWQRNFQVALEHLTKIYMLTTALTRDHIIAGEKVKTMLSLLLPEMDIQELPLRFAAVATDLLTGSSYVFKTGPISLATQASSAIPGVFPPVKHQSMQLVDGAIVALVPVLEAYSLGADVVIAVDVSPSLQTNRPFKTGLEIWLRADQITNLCLRSILLQQADAVIRVQDMHYSWHAFHAAKEIMVHGEKAAQQALPVIQAALHAYRPIPWWKSWLRSSKKQNALT